MDRGEDARTFPLLRLRSPKELLPKAVRADESQIRLFQFRKHRHSQSVNLGDAEAWKRINDVIIIREVCNRREGEHRRPAQASQDGAAR